MTLDESRTFIAQDRVIWPAATAKMNSARCSEERETR